jgi:hypothetical protein
MYERICLLLLHMLCDAELYGCPQSEEEEEEEEEEGFTYTEEEEGEKRVSVRRG